MKSESGSGNKLLSLAVSLLFIFISNLWIVSSVKRLKSKPKEIQFTIMWNKQKQKSGTSKCFGFSADERQFITYWTLSAPQWKLWREDKQKTVKIEYHPSLLPSDALTAHSVNCHSSRFTLEAETDIDVIIRGEQW